MSDDDRLKRIGEILDALREQALPPEELASLDRELDQYVQVRDPNANAVAFVMYAPPAEFELLAFAQRLKSRQGTTIPDFEELRRKKAEIDRKLLDDPPP